MAGVARGPTGPWLRGFMSAGRDVYRLFRCKLWPYAIRPVCYATAIQKYSGPGPDLYEIDLNRIALIPFHHLKYKNCKAKSVRNLKIDKCEIYICLIRNRLRERKEISKILRFIYNWIFYICLNIHINSKIHMTRRDRISRNSFAYTISTANCIHALWIILLFAWSEKHRFVHLPFPPISLSLSRSAFLALSLSVSKQLAFSKMECHWLHAYLATRFLSTHLIYRVILIHFENQKVHENVRKLKDTKILYEGIRSEEFKKPQVPT